MWSGDLVAYVLSSTGRRDVRRQTLDNLARTDWGAPAVVVLDQGRSEVPQERALDNARSLLVRAVNGRGDVFLFLEDDLDFNRSLRSNVERWPPLVDRPRGGHLYGSLYDPDIGSVAPDEDQPTHRVVVPELVYGSQAVLMAAATACSILESWDDIEGLHDTRMALLAARVTPIHYHRPSLVQHLPVPSTWGGVAHQAIDYDPDWRAPQPEVRPGRPTQPASS
jgi:hypothetical protein